MREGWRSWSSSTCKSMRRENFSHSVGLEGQRSMCWRDRQELNPAGPCWWIGIFPEDSVGLWKFFKLQPATNVLALSKSATFFIALASDNQLCEHDPEAAEALPKKGSAHNIVNELYFNKNWKKRIWGKERLNDVLIISVLALNSFFPAQETFRVILTECSLLSTIIFDY